MVKINEEVQINKDKMFWKQVTKRWAIGRPALSPVVLQAFAIWEVAHLGRRGGGATDTREWKSNTEAV